MKYDVELSNEVLLKYFYYIQEYIKDISGIKDTKDTDDNNYMKDYNEKHESNFVKYINNLVVV